MAYIHEEGAFGTSVFDAFKKQAESQGISVAKEITYSPTNFSDATTQVREAARSTPTSSSAPATSPTAPHGQGRAGL